HPALGADGLPQAVAGHRWGLALVVAVATGAAAFLALLFTPHRFTGFRVVYLGLVAAAVVAGVLSLITALMSSSSAYAFLSPTARCAATNATAACGSSACDIGSGRCFSHCHWNDRFCTPPFVCGRNGHCGPRTLAAVGQPLSW